MTENRDEERERQLYLRKRIRDFIWPMLYTAIPLIALAITTAAMAGRGGELLWWPTLSLCILVMLASSILAIAGKQRIALGLLAGSSIALVGLVVSCAATLR